MPSALDPPPALRLCALQYVHPACVHVEDVLADLSNEDVLWVCKYCLEYSEQVAEAQRQDKDAERDKDRSRDTPPCCDLCRDPVEADDSIKCFGCKDVSTRTAASAPPFYVVRVCPLLCLGAPLLPKK